MTQKLKQAFDWFCRSSSDPASISLSLKSVLPLLVLLGIEQTDIALLEDGIVQVVVGIGTALSAVGFVLGMLRKIYYTVVPPTE